MMLSFRTAEQSGLITARGLGDLELICSPWVYCEIPEAIGVRLERGCCLGFIPPLSTTTFVK